MQKVSNKGIIGNDLHVDIELLRACQKNKRKAQEKLYKACFSFLMPVCMRYHNNEHDARASFNIAFMKIIKNLDSLDWKEASFAAWIRRVMNNTLIDEYRKVKRQRERYPSKETDRELEYHSDGSKNKALSNIGQGEILSLLNRLKPDSKRVFMLYAIEGYSHKEISEIMEIPEGTSKWHLSHARKELRIMIEKLERIELKNIAI